MVDKDIELSAEFNVEGKYRSFYMWEFFFYDAH